MRRDSEAKPGQIGIIMDICNGQNFCRKHLDTSLSRFSRKTEGWFDVFDETNLANKTAFS